MISHDKGRKRSKEKVIFYDKGVGRVSQKAMLHDKGGGVQTPPPKKKR